MTETAESMNFEMGFSFNEEDFEALENLTDLQVLPDKTEARISIADIYTDKNGAIICKDKNGKMYVSLKCVIDEVPSMEGEFERSDYKPIKHMLYVPIKSAYTEPEKFRQHGTAWKTFHKAFDIPLTAQGNFMDFIGKQATVILSVELNEQFGNKNQIKRFIITH